MKLFTRLVTVAAATATLVFLLAGLALAQGPGEVQLIEKRTIPAGGGVVTVTVPAEHQLELGFDYTVGVTVTLSAGRPYSVTVKVPGATVVEALGSDTTGNGRFVYETAVSPASVLTVRRAEVTVRVEVADATDLELVISPAEPEPAPTPAVTPTVTAESWTRSTTPVTLTGGVPYTFTVAPGPGEKWDLMVRQSGVTVTVTMESLEAFGFDALPVVTAAGDKPARLVFTREWQDVRPTPDPIVTNVPGQVITVTLTSDGNTVVGLVVDRPAGTDASQARTAVADGLPQTSAALSANGGNPEDEAPAATSPPSGCIRGLTPLGLILGLGAMVWRRRR